MMLSEIVLFLGNYENRQRLGWAVVVCILMSPFINLNYGVQISYTI